MTKREEIVLILIEVVELLEYKETYKKLGLAENEIKLMLKEDLMNLSNFELNYSEKELLGYDKLLNGYTKLIENLKKEQTIISKEIKLLNIEFDKKMKEKDNKGWVATVIDKNGLKREATDEDKVAFGKSLLMDRPKTKKKEWLSKWNMYEEIFKNKIIEHVNHEKIFKELDKIFKSDILNILKKEIKLLDLKNLEANEKEAKRFNDYWKRFGDLEWDIAQQEKIDRRK